MFTKKRLTPRFISIDLQYIIMNWFIKEPYAVNKASVFVLSHESSDPSIRLDYLLLHDP